MCKTGFTERICSIFHLSGFLICGSELLHVCLCCSAYFVWLNVYQLIQKFRIQWKKTQHSYNMADKWRGFTESYCSVLGTVTVEMEVSTAIKSSLRKLVWLPPLIVCEPSRLENVPSALISLISSCLLPGKKNKDGW